MHSGHQQAAAITKDYTQLDGYPLGEIISVSDLYEI